MDLRIRLFPTLTSRYILRALAGQRAREVGRQARRPFADTEQPVARHRAPVVEDRLVVAALAGEGRHDEITAIEPLARRLGEARLVAPEERDVGGAGEEESEGQRPGDRRLAPGVTVIRSNQRLTRTS